MDINELIDGIAEVIKSSAVVVTFILPHRSLTSQGLSPHACTRQVEDAR